MEGHGAAGAGPFWALYHTIRKLTAILIEKMRFFEKRKEHTMGQDGLLQRITALLARATEAQRRQAYTFLLGLLHK